MTKREYVQTMRRRYQETSDRRGKGQILDELVEVAGYHRKHAIRLMSSRATDRLDLAQVVSGATGLACR